MSAPPAHPERQPGRVHVVSSDLLLGSRIVAAYGRLGVPTRLIDDPTQLDAPMADDRVYVDWSERTPAWVEPLASWVVLAPPTASLVLYGRHTDIEAHDAARASGLGPMRARSWIVRELEALEGA